jgi:hypothetical protein
MDIFWQEWFRIEVLVMDAMLQEIKNLVLSNVILETTPGA